MNIACICPPDGTRHPAGDEVGLREKLDFRSATTMRKVISLVYLEDPDASVADLLGALTEHYLLLGVESWTLLDEQGKPIPVNKPAIREYLLSRTEIAMEVGDAADELYSESVVDPLVAKASRSSPPTPTDDSTSAPTASTSPMPSSPSSTSTTPMDDIGMTSSPLVGASSSSPNYR